jgi:hypothetical protein
MPKEKLMETCTIKTRETGKYIGERVKVNRLPKRKRNITKVIETLPLPGNKRFITTIISNNKAGNKLTDNIQNKFGALAAVMFDGTNTTPDDVERPVANAPMTAGYKPYVFVASDKQLRTDRKYCHNKSRR